MNTQKSRAAGPAVGIDYKNRETADGQKTDSVRPQKRQNNPFKRRLILRFVLFQKRLDTPQRLQKMIHRIRIGDADKSLA